MQLTTTVPHDNPLKRAFIGIGAGDWALEGPCALSLFNASALLYAARIEVTLCLEMGNCHVDDMRNSIVRAFMESKADDLVFIDEDVGFGAEDLARLILHKRDVVGGVYPKKQEDECYPVIPIPGDIWSDAEGLVEVEGLPTGFLKLSRKAVTQLWDNAKPFRGNDGRDYREVFYREIYEGSKWSHDYTLCRNWRRMGGRIYIDPLMHFTHTGKRVWEGRVGDYWRKVNSDGDELKKQIARLKAGEPDFEALRRAWGNEAWTAPVGFLKALWGNCTGNVLECGSGLSTLVLAAKCKVTSLEHDPSWAMHTRAMLERCDLEAEVLCKPLKNEWYDYPGGEFDALVIDGPPRGISKREIALSRVNAPLVIWDDYEQGLDNPIIDGRFALQKVRG